MSKDRFLITVCAKCELASCIQTNPYSPARFCTMDNTDQATIVPVPIPPRPRLTKKLPRKYLKAMAREHPSWWKTDEEMAKENSK